MPKYVGRRIVPKHGGIWDKTKEYEELIIVLCQETGVSYISKLPVPAGTEIFNEHYERLVDDLRERLNEKMDERQQLSQEEQLLSEMKHNYDFFIRCLEALPEINKAGMKLNVNGLDTDGSCLRDFGGKARSKILSDIRRGKRKMGADRVEQAPDFLEFEKGIYFAFIKEGIVDGDVVTYTTNFGVKLTSTGNSRTLMAFIGFRRCNPNKTVEVLMDGWQVNGLCIRYHREKRKEKTAHTLMIRKRKAQERALLEQEA